MASYQPNKTLKQNICSDIMILGATIEYDGLDG